MEPVTVKVVYDPDAGVKYDGGVMSLELLEVMFAVALEAVRRELLARRLGLGPPAGAIVVGHAIPRDGGAR